MTPTKATRRQLLQSGSLVLLLGVRQIARGAEILAVRVWPAKDYTRLTIESDSEIKARQFLIADPPRVAIDIEGIDLLPALRELVDQIYASLTRRPEAAARPAADLYRGTLHAIATIAREEGARALFRIRVNGCEAHCRRTCVCTAPLRLERIEPHFGGVYPPPWAHRPDRQRRQTA